MLLYKFINKISIFYIIAWCISPPLYSSKIGKIICYIALSIWILMYFIDVTYNRKKMTYYHIVVVLSIFITLFYARIYNDNKSFSINTQLYILYVLAFFYMNNRKNMNIEYNIIYNLITILMTIWMSITIFYLNLNPVISRAITAGYMSSYQRIGVGGYSFIYLIAVMVPIWIFLHLNSRDSSLILKMVRLLNIILGCVLIVKAGFSIALLFLIIGIFYILFSRKSHFKKSILFIIFLIFYIIISINLAGTLNLSTKVLSGTYYEIKVLDLINSITNETSIGTVSLRSIEYMKSIKSFLQSPILGVGNFSKTGRHSTVLDYYSVYGFLFATLIIYSILKIPVYYLKTESKNSKTIIKWVIFYTISILSINVLPAELSVVLFFYLPITLEKIKNERNI